MALLINLGSGGIDNKGKGWTNTHEQAKRNAYLWFYKPMMEQGFKDIKVTDTGHEIDGRWIFEFKHEITKKVVECEVHGIDNLEAYQKEFIFASRVYWNGSSSSNPTLEDFKEALYKPVMTYEAISYK